MQRKSILRVGSLGQTNTRAVALGCLLTTLNLQGAPWSAQYDFNNCANPPGTTLTGVARVADDGTGTNCVLHLTDANQCSIAGGLLIPNPAGGTNVNSLHVRWRSRVGGDTAALCTATQFERPGADGYSFNWAPDLNSGSWGPDGSGTGVSVTVDTFDNGGGEAPGLEIRYQGARVAFDSVTTDPGAAKDFLRKNEFVEVDLTVEPNGKVTLDYDGRIFAATLPAWSGMAGGNFLFLANTGGASDNHWVDNVSIQSPECAVPPLGAVGWWSAEGNAGDRALGNDGSLMGGLGFGPGRVGQGLDFTAGGQGILVPASTGLNVSTGSGFTVEGWIRPNDLIQMPVVEWNSAGSPGAHFWVNVLYDNKGGPGSLYASLHGGLPGIFASAPGVIQVGVWQHVAMTWDQTTGLARLFRNGAVVATTNLSGQTPQTSANLYLGLRPGGPSFRGKLDELSIYNRALTGAELFSIYQSGMAGKCQPPLRPNAPSYAFSTFAGKALIGTADGEGDVAQFRSPNGVAVDQMGTIYVADGANNTIRKMTPAGVVSTIAGLGGIVGSADGTNRAARFSGPFGIAVNAAGHLFVTDTYNHTIRRITPVGTNWVVTTVAGAAGSPGSNDGTGAEARFDLPAGITIDSAGDLYVTDSSNATVRRLTPSGSTWVVTTIAGSPGLRGSTDGTGSAARFRDPNGIAADPAGNLYVVEAFFAHTVRKLTRIGSAWNVTTVAGLYRTPGTTDGTGSNARFDRPTGIAVDVAGNAYIADTENHTIRKMSPAGVVTTLAGLGGSSGNVDETGAFARFFHPLGIAVDTSGNVYVGDTYNVTIRKVTAVGVVTTMAGARDSAGHVNASGANARFRHPQGTAVDAAGNVYVADTENHTIRKITAAGSVSTLVGSPGNPGSVDGPGSTARFRFPQSIAVDGSGHLFVADTLNHTIRRVTPAGAVSTIAGQALSIGANDGVGTAARFDVPSGIAVDRFGDVYVANTHGNTIRRIRLFGGTWIVSTIAGTGLAGAADGPGGAAQFDNPYGVTVDSAGTVFVVEGSGGVGGIRRIVPGETQWIVSTVTRELSSPQGIAVDSVNNLYVADSGNHLIHQFTRAGAGWVISTIGGLSGDYGSTDGVGSSARFNYPSSIAVDAAGTLYIADRDNNAIRKGTFTAYAPHQTAPYTPLPMTGRLVVTLLPPAAEGKWRFPWEIGWRPSGVAASNLVAGNYPIEFQTTPGYLVLPLPPVQVVAGQTTYATNEYFPTRSAGETNSNPGSLTVFLGPTPPPGAGWRFLGSDGPYYPAGFTTNLLAGTYLVEFAPASGRIKPPTQAVLITSGQLSRLTVNYPLATSPPSGVLLPFPVPADRVNEEGAFPFGFNGQLQTDTGYGSAVAVQTNVVLTAAHLVFNDQTLTYVSRAHWLFRRHTPLIEPLPLTARGFYLLSGYAAQRSNDLASGRSPGESTPPSRNLDVAALYFLQPVAAGGHGGYLPSEASPNPWLTGPGNKMLVGYPVDGSPFGEASIVAGKMYQTDPQPYALTLATDPVPNRPQVYLAPWLLGFPGNSGGPLYAQFNGTYYPAGVYLGTVFSGLQPYASVVRAIDNDVVDLITFAAAQGDRGTNNSGGVITIVPSQSISATNQGYVRFRIMPPAAVRAGAGWRMKGDSSYDSRTNYTLPVTVTNTFPVEFKPIPGWILPSNQTLTVVPGDVSSQVAFYTVSNPVLVAKTNGIGLVGTTGTTYRIETRNALNSGAWLPLTTNTILTNGVNSVTNVSMTNRPASFFRALWLPDTP